MAFMPPIVRGTGRGSHRGPPPDLSPPRATWCARLQREPWGNGAWPRHADRRAARDAPGARAPSLAAAGGPVDQRADLGGAAVRALARGGARRRVAHPAVPAAGHVRRRGVGLDRGVPHPRPTSARSAAAAVAVAL